MPSDDNTTNLFVYGSLREGHLNHRRISDCKKIGKAVIEGDRKGPITVVHGNDEVEGEVYKVDERTLRSVDRLEGYDPDRKNQRGYVREETTAILDSGEKIEVEVYFVVR